MKGSDADLTPKQHQAILALLTEPTLAAVAQKVAIQSEATLWRWMKEPAFQEAYKAARRQCLERSIARMQEATGEAVNALREIMTCTVHPPAARVSAARSVLEYAVKGAEMLDLEERLAAMEEFMELHQKGLSGSGAK